MSSCIHRFVLRCKSDASKRRNGEIVRSGVRHQNEIRNISLELSKGEVFKGKRPATWTLRHLTIVSAVLEDSDGPKDTHPAEAEFEN